jgi:ABC-type antimicrobial peptide transport system permease subunit
VGVTNTILMSVTERFREIGTLKCLGALNGFLVRLFLLENAFIGALASLLGAAVGYGLAVLQLGAVFEFGILSWDVCTLALLGAGSKALGLGTLLTLLSSIYPTYMASRMKPVDAMRVEV